MVSPQTKNSVGLVAATWPLAPAPTTCIIPDTETHIIYTHGHLHMQPLAGVLDNTKRDDPTMAL